MQDFCLSASTVSPARSFFGVPQKGMARARASLARARAIDHEDGAIASGQQKACPKGSACGGAAMQPFLSFFLPRWMAGKKRNGTLSKRPGIFDFFLFFPSREAVGSAHPQRRQRQRAAPRPTDARTREGEHSIGCEEKVGPCHCEIKKKKKEGKMEKRRMALSRGSGRREGSRQRAHAAGLFLTKAVRGPVLGGGALRAALRASVFCCLSTAAGT